MPEGPQVARHARMQGERLIGRRLRADSPNGRSDDVAVLVDGLELVGIEAVGKHLLYDFGDERWLHVHLGRFGKFVAGDMPLREPQGVLRFRLFTDEVWYELRGAIAVEMYDAEARERLMGRIGPNPLDRDADPLAAYAKLAASRAPIGTLMMDQSVVGGIGNIYRSEVLFLNRVHPYAESSRSQEDVARNVARSRTRDGRRREDREDRYDVAERSRASQGCGTRGRALLRVPPDRIAVSALRRAHRDGDAGESQHVLVPGRPDRDSCG